MKRFAEKVAVVTGAGQGIGAEIARTFAAQGASVVVADKKREGIERVEGEIRAVGGDCFSVVADVTNNGQVAALFSTVKEKYGRLDVLVNNAGTIKPALFDSMTEADWNFLLDVDLKGVVFCTQAASRIMKSRKYGKIVSISSMSAHGVYMPGFASYSAAKAAVDNFTLSAARELGEWGINVNAVAPGEIVTPLTYQDQTKEEVEKKLKRSTDMTMLKRLGSVKDIANAVCFLSSDEASFITGVVLSVDGGRIDRM